MKQKASTPQSSDRGAAIIKRATEIMAQGHYGWSWALQKAREELSKSK